MFTVCTRTIDGIDCEYACSQSSELNVLVRLLEKSNNIKQYTVFEFSQIYNVSSLYWENKKEVLPENWNK